jgi:hypothetical protein
MAKLKTAILRAQETAEMTGANESLLWQARAMLESPTVTSVENVEKALFLINTYLLERELCKR